MFFLSLLLFSAVQLEGDYYVKLYRSSNEVDLFCFEQGFFNPAAGFGIVGANLNPATLGKAEDLEFFTAFSLPGVSGVDVNEFAFSTEEDGDQEDTLIGPFTAGYHALGGVNVLGFAKKVGRFGFGISYGAGYKLGIEASLSGSIYGDFEAEEDFEFTHEDFSEIPEEDTIRAGGNFVGRVLLNNPTPLRIEYSDVPISLGGGVNFGPLGLGAGLKFRNCRLLGEGGFSATADSFSIEVEDTYVEGWHVRNFGADVVFNNNEIISGNISSRGLSTTRTIVTLGTLLDARILKLSMGLDLGANYNLSGGYEMDFSLVSDLPEDFVDVDSSNLTIEGDSLITGRAVITVDSMIRESDSESDDNIDLSFGGSNFNFGLLIDLPLKLGVNGSIAISSADYKLSKVGACLYFGLPVPVIDVDLGFASDFVFLGGSEVDEFVFVPSGVLNMTFSYERDNLRFYLPLKYDVSHIAFSIAGNILEEEEDFGYDMSSSSNLWDNLAFGLGFSVKM